MKTARSDSNPRLHFGGGEWTLETQELVAIDRDIYRPATRRVHGAEAILSHLKRSGAESSLREATLQLIKSRRDEEGWYELVDGEWLSSSLASKMRMDESSERDMDSTLKDLRAELLLLRASHRTLKERIVRVEARVREEYVSLPESEALPDEHPVTQGTSNGLEASAALETSGVEDPPPEEPEDEALPRATMPTQIAVQASLKQLLGRELGLDYAAKPPPPADKLMEHQTSLLMEEEGRELGAIFVNVRAVAELGGGLLGLTAPEIEALARSGKPSEDSLAAMNEFCNNLAAAVTRASADVQVRAGPLGPRALARLGWLARATKSCLFSNKAGAELWLVTR